MSHTVTWQCARCKRQYASVAGARFIQFGQYKRRLCSTCLSELNVPPPKERKRASHQHP